MQKSFLMIVFHFPPAKSSSGVQRSLFFARHLYQHGWLAHVLTACVGAYEHVCPQQIEDIPSYITVKRVWAWDTARHFAIKGKYLICMALPDRWVSWCVAGLIQGLSMIRRLKPRWIFSTYPIASAHLLALMLHRLTGIPWIADFRDPMWDEVHPVGLAKRKVFAWLEAQVVKHCRYVVLTAPSALSLYQKRYPEIAEDKWRYIPNGYSEEHFSKALASEHYQRAMKEKTARQLVLVHSGYLYPLERDPSHFFAALAALKARGLIDANRVKIVLRASGNDSLFAEQLARLAIDDLVCLAPAIGYTEALVEMLLADGLLVFQAANCNHQVPAKIYEYFRAGKPIIAMTDLAGDTADVLSNAGIRYIAPLDNTNIIETQFIYFLDCLRLSQAVGVNAQIASRYSREFACQQLAALLDS